MAKILVLAPTGFGKSTSLGHIPELGIEGLDPKTTYLITATSKPLPFRGSKEMYPITTLDKVTDGRRIITNDGATVGKIIKKLAGSPIKNIVLDDSNYVMQDQYMANAQKKGYDIFKDIGKSMHEIFSAAETLHDQNFIMMAHYEEFRDSSMDTLSYRFKTVGKMVQDYITPEGKFDVTLFGKQSFDQATKKVTKNFVTNFDGQYPAKSPVGMFEEVYIPNDLGLVVKKVEEYYG